MCSNTDTVSVQDGRGVVALQLGSPLHAGLAIKTSVHFVVHAKHTVLHACVKATHIAILKFPMHFSTLHTRRCCHGVYLH